MAKKKVTKKDMKKVKTMKKADKNKISNKAVKKTNAKVSKNSSNEIKPVVWTDKLSVNEVNIDNQHKKIINQVNELQELINEEDTLAGVRKCIHFLDGYIKEHFTYEEEYMKKNKYPGLAEHQEIHRKFIEFYENYKKELTLKLRKVVDAKSFAKEHAKKVHEFLGEWVIEHVGKEDHKYCKFITPGKCGMKNTVSKKSVGDKERENEKNKKEIKKPIKEGKAGKINIAEIAKEIKQEQIKEQREPVKGVPELNGKKAGTKGDYVFTGVQGFDELLTQGIPKGNAVLVAGGAGSGKTIFTLQTLAHQASKGKKCLYMSFEEREERLIKHMSDFGWNPEKLMKKGNLKIQRINPFDITRNVDALLAKQKGELLIDIDPVIIPKDFKPDFIALDSLTAIASAFTGKEENYRIYIEQLFRFFEEIGATSFLITETEQIPKIFSKTGVEEFLADGVIVFYNLKHGNVRENAIEILKLRGAAHEKKIVAMQITGEGIVVYPEQEVFSEFDGAE